MSSSVSVSIRARTRPPEQDHPQEDLVPVDGYVETLLCGKYFQKSRHKVQVGLSLWVERIVHLFVRPTERVAFGEERAISAAQA